MEEIKEQPNIDNIEPQSSKKRRFWELDFIRAICVILMVFDHAMYTMGSVMPDFNGEFWANASLWVNGTYWHHPVRIGIRIVVLFLFFLICGISCTFSRSNLKRGFMCFLLGCAITFFTVVADKIFNLGVSIYFGVLHMLGISMMLYALFDWLGSLIAKLGKSDNAKKVTKIIGDYLAPAIGLILFIVFFACLYSEMRYGSFVTDVYMEDKSSSILASLFIEVKSASLSGADYWPLLPWTAIVLMGGAIGRGIYHNDKTENYLAKLDGKWNKPICFVGRHALVVYVAHQVVVFALFYLITLIAA